MESNMDWVDSREREMKEEKSKDYFDIIEGSQKFQLLSHCAPFPQKWTGTKYEPAEEGDSNISIKGVCWVLQDGHIKSAKLPYTVVKQIRALQNDDEWDFEIPFEHTLTLTAVGAGTKEVEYGLTASPKKTPISQEVLDELAKKPSPEEMVEKLKGKKAETSDQKVPDSAYEEAF